MFKDFNVIITEGYTNLFNAADKEKYVDEVWDMIQKAYASQGGIKGSGFKDKADLVKNIPFWKLGKTNGKINCVAMYKDKAGRKRVAIATDGTEDGKMRLLEIMMQDIKMMRCYVELSGKSLAFIAKNMDVSKYAVPVDQVKRKSDDEIHPVPGDDPEIHKHPNLKQYFYQREIGHHLHTKVMLGNINADKII